MSEQYICPHGRPDWEYAPECELCKGSAWAKERIRDQKIRIERLEKKEKELVAERDRYRKFLLWLDENGIYPHDYDEPLKKLLRG